MKHTERITTLWKVIELLQTGLERCGLDDQVVDAAVVSGVAHLLRPAAARGSSRASGWPAIAEA
jgi:hypothetical protein